MASQEKSPIDVTAALSMIGDYVRKNLDAVLESVAPEATDKERIDIKLALAAAANQMDPEGSE